jgi:hypothetical protein
MKDEKGKFLRKIDARPHLLRFNDARNGVVVTSAPMKNISLGVLDHVCGLIDHVLGMLKSEGGCWKEFLEARSHTIC